MTFFKKTPKTVISIGTINFNECDKKPRYKLVIFLLNIKNNTLMGLTLAANQGAPIVLGLLDQVTNLPVTSTFSGVSNSLDNATVAKVVTGLSAYGDLQGIPGSVAAGQTVTGNLTTNATVAYTNSGGTALTAPFTQVTPYSITGVQTADGVILVVTLGTPYTLSAPAAS